MTTPDAIEATSKNALSVTGLISRLNRQFNAALDAAFEGLPITHADWDALRYIAARPECRVGDVASVLWIGSGTATRISERLVERGLLRRRRCRADRRVVYLSTTEEGVRIMSVAAPLAARVYGLAMEVLDAAELAFLSSTLHRLSGPFDELMAGPLGRVAA